MALRNLFDALGLDSTLQAIRDRLPASLGGKVKAESLSIVLATDQGDIPVKLDAASLAALENITATLDPASLAALENITVTLDAGSLAALETIELGASSLSALENVTVTLDAGSLAALENITVGGEVDLGAASLAALENITVTLDPASLSALETVSVAGVATETTLASILAKLLTSVTSMVNYGDPHLAVRQMPLHYWDWSFAQTVSNGVSDKGTVIRTGAGMTVNQTNGNLVITAGTTVNSETVIRANEQFSGALTFSEVTTLSQRIANNNFYAELVDVIGDNLAYNIVNATTVDVTKVGHGFTAQNVGQRIDICALSSVGVPMEGVIASIPDADTIRFTVAGWPASGSGTCSLTGWNKVELLYNSTGATAMNFNTRRQGYQNTSVALLINTTASGHLASVNVSSGIASLGDQLVTSAGVTTNRAAWRTNVPEPGVVLYYQLRAKNGAVAPASGTTWTVGMLRVEDYIAQTVELCGTRQQSTAAVLPVQLNGTNVVNANMNGAWSMTPLIAAAAATGVALTQHKLISAATTNATSVKATAGRIAAGHITNTSASWRYLKLYNKASAPTVGTDVPVQVVGLKPGDVTDLTNLVSMFGMSFATGIAYAITGAPADNDTTAISASEVIVAIQYI